MSCELSVVTTLYRSASYLPEFYTRMSKAAAAITPDYEIIFVNDGSPDNSLDLALGLYQSDPHVRVVDLTRNFGHHQAIMAGLTQACGSYVYLIDVDLEEDPEWLADFWREYHAGHFDAVYGIQEMRGGNVFRRFSGILFYKLFNLLSDTKIPESPMTVRLMSAEYVKAVLQVRDRNLFLAGTMAWTGYRQYALPLARTPRTTPTTYSIAKRVALFTNAITSFSSYPLRLVFFTGVAISALAGALGLYMLIDKILRPETILLGYASLIVSVWFLGGLMILFLGVIGIYLSRIFIEVKDRPPYLIRRVYEQKSDSASRSVNAQQPIIVRSLEV